MLDEGRGEVSKKGTCGEGCEAAGKVMEERKELSWLSKLTQTRTQQQK